MINRELFKLQNKAEISQAATPSKQTQLPNGNERSSRANAHSPAGSITANDALWTSHPTSLVLTSHNNRINFIASIVEWSRACSIFVRACIKAKRTGPCNFGARQIQCGWWVMSLGFYHCYQSPDSCFLSTHHTHAGKKYFACHIWRLRTLFKSRFWTPSFTTNMCLSHAKSLWSWFCAKASVCSVEEISLVEKWGVGWSWVCV